MDYYANVLNVPFMVFFFFIFIFSTVDSKYDHNKNFAVAGFEVRTYSIKSSCSSHWATITASILQRLVQQEESMTGFYSEQFRSAKEKSIYFIEMRVWQICDNIFNKLL